jgi:hypothetical protein
VRLRPSDRIELRLLTPGHSWFFFPPHSSGPRTAGFQAGCGFLIVRPDRIANRAGNPTAKYSDDGKNLLRLGAEKGLRRWCGTGINAITRLPDWGGQRRVVTPLQFEIGQLDYAAVTDRRHIK